MSGGKLHVHHGAQHLGDSPSMHVDRRAVLSFPLFSTSASHLRTAPFLFQRFRPGDNLDQFSRDARLSRAVLHQLGVLINSSALFVALSIAVIRAPCSPAALFSNAE